MKPAVLILHASGTNRDHEAAWACELAGGLPEIVHINQLRGALHSHRLADYQMLVVAGGFSYGDALGAGRRLALDLTLDVQDDLARFVEQKKPILGICNGFQALVKAGLLPNLVDLTGEENRIATLTHNQHGHFECRWVTLLPNPNSPCVFTRELTEPIYCPVAHGEGRFVRSEGLLEEQITLSYKGADYPTNPNGSSDNIAAVCNTNGTIMGLMPHPEDHIVSWQHPRWTRGESGRKGLPMFEAGIRYAAEVG
ncbi:phosphoribosylformylglycinamidine synthase subunit PurQ [Anaerolineales bacterium HSG25]|nr:phosphoribosylformylglycinamidine synthase subunit PurQ [Anaerolineales bacterium HSG25]